MNEDAHASIGIFDSGFGGLTVMKAITTLLPHENIIYFGDTARLPYGTKSQETILRYSLENASFLVNQGVKVLVIACHTACCFALNELQTRFDLPVIGVTIPSIHQAIALSSRGKIAVLGTRGTIASGSYQKSLEKLLPSAEITSIQCQLLVHLVEEGYLDHPITIQALEGYLQPLKGKEIDTLILGCTHFPLLEKHIRKISPPGIHIIDPASACAASLHQTLLVKNILNLASHPPSYQFYVSDNPEKFKAMAPQFLGYSLHHVSSFDPSNLSITSAL